MSLSHKEGPGSGSSLRGSGEKAEGACAGGAEGFSVKIFIWKGSKAIGRWVGFKEK